jgi:hypothetical protein
MGYDFWTLELKFILLKLRLRVISIPSVSIDVLFVFLHKPQYAPTSKLCVSIDAQFLLGVRVCACQKSKTCKNFVKHTTHRMGGL